MQKESMKKIIFLCLLGAGAILFLVDCDVIGKSLKVSKLKDISQNTKMILLFPVNCLKENALTKSRLNLSISIPEDFCSVVPFEDAMRADMSEFIPKTDKSVDEWSEMITAQKFVGRSISASQIVNHIKRGISQNANSYHLLDSIDKENSGYLESSFAMTYTYNGRKEIVLGIYYSGPYDCSGFQYAIVLNAAMTEKMAQQKILNFIKNNISIITF